MLIELCGIDGSGKTTFAERIMRLFNDQGVPCYQRSFRSTAKRVAADLAAREGHRHWSGLFAPDAIETAHAFEMVQMVYQQVLPLDLDAQVIVTDSYTCGWLATARLWGAESLDQLSRIYGLLPVPDLSISLDVPVAVARRRIADRQKGDHIMKVGPDSVIGRYAAAFAATRPLIGYPQVIIDGDEDLEVTWQQVRAATLAARRPTQVAAGGA